MGVPMTEVSGKVIRLGDGPCGHRARGILRHAAELLETDAEVLKACSTVDGDWGAEVEAKADYEDMKRTARELRTLCGDGVDHS